MKEYTVHSKFDIMQHKSNINFFNYLEVCISPEGEVVYAVPSHVQCLERILKQQCCKDGRSYTSLMDDNYTRWPDCLCDLTGYCMVWNDFVTKPTTGLTKAQKQKLLLLKHTYYTRGTHPALYRGKL